MYVYVHVYVYVWVSRCVFTCAGLACVSRARTPDLPHLGTCQVSHVYALFFIFFCIFYWVEGKTGKGFGQIIGITTWYNSSCRTQTLSVKQVGFWGSFIISYVRLFYYIYVCFTTILDKPWSRLAIIIIKAVRVPVAMIYITTQLCLYLTRRQIIQRWGLHHPSNEDIGLRIP